MSRGVWKRLDGFVGKVGLTSMMSAVLCCLSCLLCLRILAAMFSRSVSGKSRNRRCSHFLMDGTAEFLIRMVVGAEGVAVTEQGGHAE